MFNLLPQNEKSNLEHEYRLRFAVVGLFLFCSLGTVAFIALIPSFFLSHQKESVIAESYALLNKDEALGSKSKLEEVLAVTEKEVKALKTAIPVSYAYELIADVIHAKPADIKVSGIRITKNKTGSRSLALIGQANDRESLLAFARSLEQEKDFVKVTVPVSNFVEAENINYSIVVDSK
jgi:hypothetical protein